MRIIFSEPFRRDYKKLPLDIIQIFDKTLILLHTNLRHPSIRIKKLPSSDIWYGRISRNYRFTFEYKNDTILLRRIGLHAILDQERRNI